VQDSGIKRIGLIINPIAGMGGRVGLKGTDGRETYEEAVKRGAQPVSTPLMIVCLDAMIRFFSAGSRVLFLLCRGSMGGEILGNILIRTEGVELEYLPETGDEPTTAADTMRAAEAMIEKGAELIVFAGGDGTARDVLIARKGSPSTDLPMMLGVPAGVKMHSSVFALSPEAAGEIMAAFARGETGSSLREVMDIDETDYRNGSLTARLYGYAPVPSLAGMVQHSKCSDVKDDELEKEDIAEEMYHEIMENRGEVYFLGAGTTVFAVKKRLGVAGSLLGVDAVRGDELIGKDIWEKHMLELLRGNICKIVLTPIGRQGFLIGRGNQQFSPEVLGKVGIENIRVISTGSKLDEINELIIYTGDRELDERFPKFVRVLVRPDRYRMVKVVKV